MVDEKTLKILKKILPKLLKNPNLMFGHDTSSEEVDYVVENGKLPINMLENLGGDNFFVLYAKKFEITEEEGKMLDFYLEHKIRKDAEELKKLFPFLA